MLWRRKVLTVPVFLFVEIENAAWLWEAHIPEMGDVLSRHEAILRKYSEKCGGEIFKHTGYSTFVVFEDGGFCSAH